MEKIFCNADPCELNEEWLIVYNNKVHDVEGVNRDEHKAPYSVSLGWLGKDPSIEFIRNNTIPMKPIMDSMKMDRRINYSLNYGRAQRRERFEDVAGFLPACLEWRIKPSIIKDVLNPGKKGQFLGVVDMDDINLRMHTAVIGKYTGNYEYRNDGVVSADVDPKYRVQNWAQYEDNHFQQARERDIDKNSLLIGDLNKLLPDTRTTLNTLNAWKEHSFSDKYRKELRQLEEDIEKCKLTV